MPGLREEGLDVVGPRRARTALRRAAAALDAIVLDIGLPDADGRDLCLALRARASHAPCCSSPPSTRCTERIAGFRAGGDDYLTKPFAIPELVARLHALLRRTEPAPPAAVSGLLLDPAGPDGIGPGAGLARRRPSSACSARSPAPRRHPAPARGRRLGWPDGAIVRENTLDQYVARVRRKLREVAPDRDRDRPRRGVPSGLMRRTCARCADPRHGPDHARGGGGRRPARRRIQRRPGGHARSQTSDRTLRSQAPPPRRPRRR